jgi:phospholipid-binding lipoprotein MlaA
MIRFVALACVALTLGACTPVPQGDTFADPLETANRGVFELNKGVDTIALRPVSRVYGAVVPDPVKNGFSNFASNLDQPGIVVNDLLQGQGFDAGHNLLRFTMNTLFGFGGLLDPATEMGLEKRTTDFGATLHQWGAGEGAYVVLPFLGSSTVRDAIGSAVDVAANPTRVWLKDDLATGASVANAASLVGDRHRYSGVIDSVLYESADGYAQARLLYLQNRRFELNGDTNEDTVFDPFAEPEG